jgi:glutamate-5-semialdehyde dehydrogenase
MIAAVRAVRALDDPVGRVLEHTTLDTGLELTRVGCPLGLLAVIFESRPDAVTQISALAIKSGNAVVLKGGRDAARTTGALVTAIRAGLDGTDVPPDAVVSVEGRESVDALLALDGVVDLVIPRGSKELVRYVQTHTKIPVLGHAEGVCHVYVDSAADPEMAVAIVVDAKVQYPAACNAAEAVLIHVDVAPLVLPLLLDRLTEAGVEVRACPRTRSLAAAHRHTVKAATPEDWGREFGELILAVRIIDSLDEALAHIAHYGSAHTEAIVTEDPAAAERFLAEVDAAGVFHNASTRFADGYRYGLGAEVGVGTGKVHARGPVGLAGLTTYKYLLSGRGHIVADYVGSGRRRFRHERPARKAE